ncbi:kinase-like domain-containing protein [Halteromyces radiatus]|uniref:kinase-like domain-containing protein n=1 Tax=Halteromyces radiatus TaxID=101107 RepID=UPI002220B24C|nr:kinase-like domain-containing protein [Halteromyces radiatus]KAI8081344.1 kinase-like domain-containing protein [Halteromyces radiatus]
MNVQEDLPSFNITSNYSTDSFLTNNNNLLVEGPDGNNILCDSPQPTHLPNYAGPDHCSPSSYHNTKEYVKHTIENQLEQQGHQDAHPTPTNSQEQQITKRSTRRVKPRRVIGNYTLVSTLGSGSMGKVRLAIHNLTQEKLAVKIVPRVGTQEHLPKDEINAKKKKEKDQQSEIRTIREASIMLLLHHPYIVSLKEMIVLDPYYYMFMEYVDGGQLLDFIISHGKLKERHARRFARQIVSALDYCHRNSVVHRDLKIENILISQNGNIKIIDFGLSNLFSPRSHLSTFCGSLYFAAPELLNAKAYTGPEVDVWSFGIVLYVLVCGKVPFDDQNMAMLHEKIKRGVVDYPSSLSSDCKNILSRMLVVNPSHRASTAEITIHPWMNKGYNEPIDNFLPDRVPLTLPVDMEVVRGMTGFEFGTEQEIKSQLETIIQSDEYQKAASALAERQSQQSHRYPSHSPLSRRPPVFNLPNDDPQSIPAAYHPLISIYYLVKERLDREQQQSNNHQNDDSSLHLPIKSIHSPSSLHRNGTIAPTHSMIPENATTTDPRARFDLPSQPNTIISMPEAAHAAQPSISQHQPNLFITPTDSPSTSTGVAYDRRHGLPLSINTKINHHQLEENEGSSLSAGTRRLGRTFSKMLSRKSAGHEDKIKPDEWKSGSGDNQHDRLHRSTTTTTTHEHEQSFPNNAGGTLHQRLGTADEQVKPVFLKGLFSVSTTSTKHPSVIRADLIRVLERIGVKWRESKDRFECVHVPSIDMNRVTTDGSTQSLSSSSSNHNNPAVTVPDLVVRFEIYIVKVPWLLGMHGLQFRRVSGDTWQYKNICSIILTELKL